LERALGDAEHEVREVAVGALGALPRPLARSAAVAITGRLDDDHPAVRQRAAVVLARLGEARAVIPLVGRLSDGSREVRMAALVAALGRDDLRQAAREGLRLAGPAAMAPVAARLPGATGDELAAEVELLGELGDGRAAPVLLAELQRGRLARERLAAALGKVT